uniref:Peptidase C1A papain C-terminal domain-containing protein n=1 Tax=Tetradesmus obliquus TaxID=3088 RepID=A0A383WI10_TETOB
MSCGTARLRLAFAALLVVFLWASHPVAGQGLPASSKARISDIKNFGKLLRYTKDGAAFRGAYAANPSKACSAAGDKGLCAAAAGSEEATALLVATSPAVYDARNDAGDFNPISPVKDQRPCQTSVAFAITAAAEAAAASALQINGSSISLSQQDLQFCPGLQRGCYDNWEIRPALERLVNDTVVDSECLPYTAPQSDDPARLCNYRCRDPPRAILQGKFGYSPLRDVISAQKQIRRYGAFVTRFNLYEDFFEWVAKVPQKDPAAVYTCPKSSTPAPDAQAVAVVGYDNVKQAWIVKNSWGAATGDRGFFRVKFGVCGMMAPGDTFGVFYLPDALKTLEVAGAAPSRQGKKCYMYRGKKCYMYRARKEDSLAKIADRTVVSIGQLLTDNIQAIKSLDKPLTGLRLRICNPDPATISQNGRSVGSAPPRAAAPKALKSATPESSVAAKPPPPAPAAKVAAPSDAAAAAAGSDGAGGTAAAGAADPAADPVPSPAADPAVPDPSATEAEVLLAFKSSLGDPPTLSNWKAGTPPCGNPSAKQQPWKQVYCSTFGSTQQVYIIDLSLIGLTGTLDDSVPLRNLSRLQALWMSGNELSGTLPKSWGSIRSLHEIKLDMNALTGELPMEWRDLRKLKKLFLNGNRLAGSAPPEWAELASLECLFLGGNSLTGSIPAAWSSMAKLAHSSVYDNKGLFGCLPFDWNARAVKVQLSSGPEAADGTAGLSLGGTCICGYCSAPDSSACEAEAVVSASCSALIANATGAAGSSGNGSANGTDAGSGLPPVPSPGDNITDTAGDYKDPGDSAGAADNATTGTTRVGGSGATGGAAGNGSAAAAGAVIAPITALPPTGSAGTVPATGTVGSTGAGAAGAGAAGSVAGPGGAVAAPVAAGAAGSTPAAGAGPAAAGASAARTGAGLPPGVGSTAVGSTAGSVPDGPIVPPATPAPAAAAAMPSFGGLGSGGKPVQSNVNPESLIAPDKGKSNLMEHTGSSSSRGVAPAVNADAYS